MRHNRKKGKGRLGEKIQKAKGGKNILKDGPLNLRLKPKIEEKEIVMKTSSSRRRFHVRNEITCNILKTNRCMIVPLLNIWIG